MSLMRNILAANSTLQISSLKRIEMLTIINNALTLYVAHLHSGLSIFRITLPQKKNIFTIINHSLELRLKGGVLCICPPTRQPTLIGGSQHPHNIYKYPVTTITFLVNGGLLGGSRGMY